MPEVDARFRRGLASANCGAAALEHVARRSLATPDPQGVEPLRAPPRLVCRSRAFHAASPSLPVRSRGTISAANPVEQASSDPQRDVASRTAAPAVRIEIVDALRGIAAASVAWFHFTRVGFRLPPFGWLELSGRYGSLGVEIFFVISGFVIPWSLYRSGYTQRSFVRFVARRIVRLEPPYLASIALVLALALAAPLLPPGSTVGHVSLSRVAWHLGYANVLLGQRLLNPVYWTLAIELQWYLVAALMHGELANVVARRRRTAVALLLAAAFIANHVPGPRTGLLFLFLGYFVMGIAAFHRRAGMTSRAEFLLTVGLGAAVSTYLVGLVSALAGIGTALLIAEVNARSRPLLWLGEISYSLYLVHIPIAAPFIHFAIAHHLGLGGRIAMLAGASVASLATAWALARLVERPSRRLASRIAIRRPASAARPPRTVGALTPASVRAVGQIVSSLPSGIPIVPPEPERTGA